MNKIYFEQYLRNIFGKDREREIDLFVGLVTKSSSVIDVGANRGTYALPVSRRLSNEGNLYLFEPVPFLFNYLQKGFKKKKNVKVFQLGCSDRTGMAKIKIPYNSGQLGLGSGSIVNQYSEYEEIEIEIARIDDLNLSYIDFIKIDVEGYETFVLEGAIKVIQKTKPIILVEIDWNMGNEYFQRLLDLINFIGYRILSLTGSSFLEVKISEFSSIKLNFHADGYRNNFFLIPEFKFEEIRLKLINQNTLLNYFRRLR